MKQGASAIFVCDNCQSEQTFHLPENSPFADPTVEVGKNEIQDDRAE